MNEGDSVDGYFVPMDPMVPTGTAATAHTRRVRTGRGAPLLQCDSCQ